MISESLNNNKLSFRKRSKDFDHLYVLGTPIIEKSNCARKNITKIALLFTFSMENHWNCRKTKDQQ